MYLALFLTPWMAMYALSTVVFNHWGLVSKLSGGEIGAFGKGQERPYSRAFPPGMSPSAIASGILEDLHLRGSVKVESSDSDRLVMTRLDPFHPRRITWIRSEQKLIVEKQGYQTASFLTALHSRVGYGGSSRSANFWALGVDLSILATLLWIFSGFWMWWELKVTRRWGFAFALLGLIVFGGFLVFS